MTKSLCVSLDTGKHTPFSHCLLRPDCGYQIFALQKWKMQKKYVNDSEGEY